VQGQVGHDHAAALPLSAATGDEWEEDVTRWNLMQFDLPDPPPPAH